MGDLTFPLIPAGDGSLTTGTGLTGAGTVASPIAIDYAVGPIWTANVEQSQAEPRRIFTETDQGTDLKKWDLDLNGGVFTLRTRTDADGAGVNVFAVTRGATTAITDFSIGNAANNPTFHFLGTGVVTVGGQLQLGANGLAFTSSTNSSIGLSGSTMNLAVSGTTALSLTSTTVDFKQRQLDSSSSVQTPTTGFTITIGNNVSTLILTPAGTLATGTITMPASPADKQMVRVCSTQIVTALTVSPNSGQTIAGAPTTIAPTGGFAYIYVTAITTWVRLY